MEPQGRCQIEEWFKTCLWILWTETKSQKTFLEYHHKMKLLDWMHRKFRQNNSEPFKDLVIGNSCNCLSGQPSLDDEQNLVKPNHGIKIFKQNQKGQNLRKSFAGLESARVDNNEEYYDGELSPAAMSDDLFPGFLAIGTLGTDQIISDPTSTPTFAISVESITEKEYEVTENDLKLINDELEKVLGAETNDDVSIDSSRRNSHVSTGRNSHVSIITLSGKPIVEGTRASNVNNQNGAITNAICPLQGYLFGTAIELSETTTTTVANKKEHRTSLGELFQRSKLAEEGLSLKSEKEDKRTERDADKSAINMVKEKLKKRILHHAASRNSASILHMFRKKVHPESSTAAQKSAKYCSSRKNESKKKMMMNEGGYIRGDMVYPEEDSFGFIREHWIKTDADYLVLEL